MLERRLAVGGSAEVFLARPKTGVVPAPRLVIKRLLPEVREANSFKLLEHEARLHQAVVHDNVVKIFGAGMVREEPYLAMEYIDGVDVYGLLRRAEGEQRRVPPRLAVYIAAAVARALAAVHSARDESGRALGLVHRDVTPSNIYLSNTGQIKLGDFGIARVADAPRSQRTAQGIKGKLGYLAPEQVAGEDFDHRADLFALTVVLAEMLIGQRIFPGNGQLAVLLAIRDVNVEPFRRRARELPDGLVEVCEKGLSRDPNHRYSDGHEFAEALSRFEVVSEPTLKRMLSEWVTWARDSSQLAKQLEGRIRDSVQRMRAVQDMTPSPSELVKQKERSQNPPSLSAVRKRDGTEQRDIELSRLIEMVATGELTGDDEVALMGADFQPIRNIDDLARHLLPSTTDTTARLFEPGAPDYQALLADTPMLKVLARMRQGAETGALFVIRQVQEHHATRKEIYLKNGRLYYVASSERGELLGEYLVRRGRITREQLDQVLKELGKYGGHLGDTVIGLGLVSAMDVFRAIRDQGRDRVASLCGWDEGAATFYRGTMPARVQFPLDLDLASPMMAGALVASSGDPATMLPSPQTRLVPGPRAESTNTRRERGTAPLSLQMLPGLCESRPTLSDAIHTLTQAPDEGERRSVSVKEAGAAILTAQHLGWIGFQTE